VSLIRYVGVEFTPASEPGEFQITVEMPVGTRLDVTQRAVEQVEGIIERDVPERETMFARVGQGTGFGAIFGGAGSHMARVWFRVVGLGERDRSDDDIRLALQEPLRRIPGAEAYFGVDAFSQMMFGGARLAVEIYGHDLGDARQLAMDVKRILEGIYGATDVRISRQEGKPESHIIIDHEKAAHYGLSVNSIANSVQTAVMGAIAGQYREGGKEY
jgi:HAE1 family hydrophobic/amphiphilic exporter-1